MSKFIIAFCVAVFASATFVASLQNSQVTATLVDPEQCIRGLNDTFENAREVLNYFRTQKINRYRAAMDKRDADALKKIVELVEAEKSAVLGKNVEYFSGSPIPCSNEVISTFAETIQTLREEANYGLD